MVARFAKSAAIFALLFVGVCAYFWMAFSADENWPQTQSGRAWLEIGDWLAVAWGVCTIAALYWLSDLARLRTPWNWVAPAILVIVALCGWAGSVWFAASPLSWLMGVAGAALVFAAVVNGGRISWPGLVWLSLATAIFAAAFYWVAGQIVAEYYPPEGR